MPRLAGAPVRPGDGAPVIDAMIRPMLPPLSNRQYKAGQSVMVSKCERSEKGSRPQSEDRSRERRISSGRGTAPGRGTGISRLV